MRHVVRVVRLVRGGAGIARRRTLAIRIAAIGARSAAPRAPTLPGVTTAAGDLPAPRSRARRVGGLIAGLLVAGFLAVGLISGWNRITSYSWQLDVPYLVLSVAASAAALTLAAVAYALMLERLEGRRLPRMRLVSVWGKSLLGRYVPGSIVMFAGRVVLGREAGVSGRVSLAASAYELGLSVGVSAIASVGYLLSIGDLGQGPWLLIGAVLVVLGLVVLHPRVFAPLTTWVLRKLRREPLQVFLSVRQVLALGLLYAVAYALLALGAWGTVRGLAGPEVGGPLEVGAGFLLSFVVSMLAIVFPSGLGVREGVFALVLARSVPGGVAIALAAAARVVMTLVEIAFALAVVALDRRHARGRG